MGDAHPTEPTMPPSNLNPTVICGYPPSAKPAKSNSSATRASVPPAGPGETPEMSAAAGYDTASLWGRHLLPSAGRGGLAAQAKGSVPGLQGHRQRAGSFWPGLGVAGERPAFDLGGGEGHML